MDAEDLVVDGRSEGERVEDIAESLPHLHLEKNGSPPGVRKLRTQRGYHPEG